MNTGMWLLFIFFALCIIEFVAYVIREYRLFRREQRHIKSVTDLRHELDRASRDAYRRNIERGGGEDKEDRIDNGPINK